MLSRFCLLSTICFSSEVIELYSSSLHRHIAAASPHLAGLLTVPPPPQHVLAWLNIIWNLEGVDDLKVWRLARAAALCLREAMGVKSLLFASI
mmetsp:Transcript_30826/g.51000  ORF Transcript_30826/g.51000 Transcript_30826/m.51000 type:complete len:93 (+) Transcript_30826:171-449(+)